MFPGRARAGLGIIIVGALVLAWAFVDRFLVSGAGTANAGRFGAATGFLLAGIVIVWAARR